MVLGTRTRTRKRKEEEVTVTELADTLRHLETQGYGTADVVFEDVAEEPGDFSLSVDAVDILGTTKVILSSLE